jgi:hypothetical protein
MLPPRKLPLMYMQFGVLCFLIALLSAFFLAEDLLGFFYSPHLLAITHLITLGWITSNILGAIYIAAPMSLQLWLPAKRMDHILFWTFAVGVIGIVVHFWTANPLGIAGSGMLIYITVAYVAFRVINGLRKAKAPGFVKMHIIFSFSNLMMAALWGILIAFNKEFGFLTTSFTSNLYSHIHLAAIGWVLFMIFGFAYRLVPMFIPGEPAKGILPWFSGLLMESGVLMIFFSLLFKPIFAIIPAIMLLMGILMFLTQVLRTVIRRKPVPPPKPPSPDFSILHILSSFLWLFGSAAVGIILLYSVPDEQGMRLATTYGFMALIGSMSQIIIGMRPKLMAIFTWYHVFAKQKSTHDLPRPIDMGNRGFQGVAFYLWTIATIFLVVSLLVNAANGVRIFSMLLFSAVVIASVNEVIILKRIVTIH